MLTAAPAGANEHPAPSPWVTVPVWPGDMPPPRHYPGLGLGVWSLRNSLESGAPPTQAGRLTEAGSSGAPAGGLATLATTYRGPYKVISQSRDSLISVQDPADLLVYEFPVARCYLY
jgi:hypothetical protein